MDSIKSYVALIVDKSGSMSDLTDVTINNFNEQLQVLKDESNSTAAIAKKMLLTGQNQVEGVETKVSLITFNQNVDEVFFDIDVNDAKEITKDDYVCDGMTALYDAIGITIDKFVDHYDMTDPNAGVLFVIITDGQENSSKKYAGDKGRSTVKSKIEELKKTGKWTFTFMGTEEALEAGKDFKMSTMSVDFSPEGLDSAFSAHSMATSTYYNARRAHNTSVQDLYGTVTEEETSDKTKNTTKTGT